MGLGDSQFAGKMIVTAITIMMALAMGINLYCPEVAMEIDEQQLVKGYYDFTGQSPSTNTVTWVLTGIYTPYYSGAYGYTANDHWIYGSMVRNHYTPTQYDSTTQSYAVSWDSQRNLYTYDEDSDDYDAKTGTGHKKGDVYTSVNFDSAQKSSIFFTEAMKNTQGDYFYYTFEGYRYAFQPPASHVIKTQDGEAATVSADSSSISLIWYEYYSVGSGISGQLVLSGSDRGVSYINSAQIIQAYNSSSGTARFNMTFNGIDIGIIIKMDGYYLSSGHTIEQCYNDGHWAIMVTSQSSDADTYVNPDFSLNPTSLLSTIISIMTFHYEKYGISESLGAVCTLAIMVPLYAGIIGILSRDIWMAIIGMGLLAAVQSIGWFIL